MDELIHLLGNTNLFSLLLGLVLLLMAFITIKFPPKSINMLYGYRTRRSMKNKENWEFAQKFASQEMMRGGWILVVFALSGLLFPTSILTETIAGTILMIIIFILLIVRTESHLKRFERSK